MGVKLQSALGGSVELNAPSTASNFTMTVPAGNGTVATTDQLGIFRNRIINGACNIAQRATSATNTGENYATVDRMRMRNSSTGGNVNQSQSTGPSVALPNSIKFTQATATANTSSAWYGLRYMIEKADSLVFASSTSATLSFWYKSSKAGTHAWAIDMNYTFTGSGHQVNGTFTVNAANTWEYKTITINYSVTANNTANAVNSYGVGMTIGPSIEGVTTITSMAVNDYFEITGLQFETGSVATPFEHRPFTTELSLCQRYFEWVLRPDQMTHGLGINEGGSNRTVMSITLAQPKRITNVTITPSGNLVEHWGAQSSTYVLASVACTIHSNLLNVSYSNGVLATGASGMLYFNNGARVEAEL